MDNRLPIMIIWRNEQVEPQAENSATRKRRQPRIFHPRLTMGDFTESEIRQHFRMGSTAIEDLYTRLQGALANPTQRSQAIPGMSKLLAVMHYLASGSFQYCIGSKMGFSQATFSRIVHQVVDALVNVATEYIHFPNCENEIRLIKEEFFRQSGFPNVLGLLDCTHVALIPPARFEADYRNRKLYHSLNVQIVCGPTMEILDVVASFPGSSHDSYILQQSYLGAMFSNGAFGNSILLGDNGYRLNSWLMTPYLTPTSAAERKFNKAHRRTRSKIERLFGILKSRFRCLDISGGALLYKPEFVGKIVVACCILNNIAQRHNMPIDIATDLREHISFQGEYRQEGTNEGRLRQRDITQRFFSM